MKVVSAWPNVKFGIMAKPSTRMTITLHAMTASPKLFVSDCTTSMAMEKIACVTPEGTPRWMIFPTYSRCGLRWAGAA